jgi:hypothetical protein
MPARPRPLFAVRLIGPTATVTTQKAHLLTYLARYFGKEAVCRTSSHSARNAGESRVYITVTAKEVKPH